MFCAHCGSPNDDTAKFCFKCGAATVAAGSGAAASPQPDPRMRGGAAPHTVAIRRLATGKNPTVATILSVFIPGVGQFYNGDMKKGAVMLGIGVLLGALTAGVGWLGMMIWSAIDAYKVASGQSSMW
jgi:TM2 domain-containing membrane protein YozV